MAHKSPAELRISRLDHAGVAKSHAAVRANLKKLRAEHSIRGITAVGKSAREIAEMPRQSGTVRVARCLGLAARDAPSSA
jgi:hypothetical protein